MGASVVYSELTEPFSLKSTGESADVRVTLECPSLVLEIAVNLEQKVASILVGVFLVIEVNQL